MLPAKVRMSVCENFSYSIVGVALRSTEGSDTPTPFEKYAVRTEGPTTPYTLRQFDLVLPKRPVYAGDSFGASSNCGFYL